MSTANAELRRPTGVGGSDLIGIVVIALALSDDKLELS
jgi:hypothetical protein